MIAMLIILVISVLISINLSFISIKTNNIKNLKRYNIILNDNSNEYESIPKSINQIINNNIKSFTKRLSSLLLTSFTINKVLANDNIVNESDNLTSYIDLNTNLPNITDICWFDVSIDNGRPKRIEISLFGDVTPITSTNFKALCLGIDGYSYKGSDIFRIISNFSIQGGNIGNPIDCPNSKLSRYGKSAKLSTISALTNVNNINKYFNTNNGFAIENYYIKHDYVNAGVVSMMKDLTNKGLQDSRFFITLSPASSWADDKYTAFGLITLGMNVINEISQLDVIPPSNYPKVTVKIVDSGCYSNPSDKSSIAIARFVSFNNYINMYS